MKNQISYPILYILLQVLGIWVDGVLGIGFEIMALLIFSMGKKRSMLSLFRQGIFIVIVEILIDLFCGNAEMIFETGVWFFEEMRRVVQSWNWVFSLTIIFVIGFCQKEKILRIPCWWIDKIFYKFNELLMIIVSLLHLEIQNKNENPEFLINQKFGMTPRF